jgi:hypothetical protein
MSLIRATVVGDLQGDEIMCVGVETRAGRINSSSGFET